MANDFMRLEDWVDKLWKTNRFHAHPCERPHESWLNSRNGEVSVMHDEIPVTRGSGNVFADLGFDEVEAEELQVKAELTRQIYNRIKALGLTQRHAGTR